MHPISSSPSSIVAVVNHELNWNVPASIALTAVGRRRDDNLLNHFLAILKFPLKNPLKPITKMHSPMVLVLTMNCSI
jgi:hypothetical protein